jgi:tetratricopeptide (TPR) repeat protein
MRLPQSTRATASGSEAPSPASPGSSGDQAGERGTAKKTLLLLSLLLVAGTWFCYRNLRDDSFISFDDPAYIVHNNHVRTGVTWSGIVWAFQAVHASNWHPLTWISHMVDCSLFALNPAGHHFTNLLFHIANTLLLFGLWHRLTGSIWRSFFVAAFFAWHPLHVESVAWISERKDVLSTFFFMLTLLAYARYARNPPLHETPSPRRFSPSGAKVHPFALQNPLTFYFLSLVFFALGLLSKPMLVTLPFVLLLLDIWPLSRVHLQSGKVRSMLPLATEKIPFFVLSLASACVTFLAQRQSGAVSSFQIVSPGLRLANAVVSYPRYILKTIWPAKLSIIYPYPDHWPALTVIAALLFLGVVSWLCLKMLSRRPYLAVGWFWYLGTLVPVIGFVQVGSQAIADRYTYIPGIGLLIMIVWGLADLTISAIFLKGGYVTPAAASVALVACAICSAKQLEHWKNGETLFRHAIEVTDNNYAAYDGLGSALADAGKSEEALRWLSKAVQIAPGYSQAQFNLGTLLLQLRRFDEALDHLRIAVTLNPNSAESHENLGIALFRTGKLEDAKESLVKTIRLNPGDAEAHHVLGLVLLNQSKPVEAAPEFAATLRLNPHHAEAHRNLGVAFAQLGHISEAAAEFGEAVHLSPADPVLRSNLGLALSQLNRPDEALIQFAEAARLNPADPNNHYRLAGCANRLHRSTEAIDHYREALRLKADFPEALNELAWLLATHPDPALRWGSAAVTLAEKACSLTKSPPPPATLLTLSAAYAEAGRLPDAIATAQKAQALAQETGETNALNKAVALLGAFQAGKPYHEAR